MPSFSTILSGMVLLLAGSAMAGQNCKCQDPSGTGPQYNDATETCCGKLQCGGPAGIGGSYYPGPNHQCSASGTNCLDSGAFVQCCKDLGGPGAYCWN
ncbi:uncharacterized protein K489DRAFT_331331 [Dissoconium aciculare CBS 342.82]|uniref:Uncharacterized protein n=1 Tax=Dissoconium aciculare CBS 342.82 TaxID=1314786 RepID=A0A6J3MCW4_9PEZI|nr:uncharacterized protein K489DRAFT_331331 [Dissoconium aciculare CBS 342.82]KAF1825866.1 hypothetical protein K489DRAFT_331331 [Dissoconium aciculare CBS 342.82]